MNSIGQATLNDVGVDWLTLTTKEESRYAEWRDAFEFVAEIQQQQGHKWFDSRLFGYSGMSCGGVFLGKGVNGGMLRLSGALAEVHGFLFSPEAVRCTRIDLQVTAELSVARPDLLEQMYESARMSKPKNGRPVMYTLIKQSNGGRTLYVGSRSSVLYGRLYDKGVEQATHAPGKLLRWELECKDYAAEQAVQQVYPITGEGFGIAQIVGKFFEDRAIRVAWSYVRPDEWCFTPARTEDTAGSLKWLAGPVAGVVARLIDTVGPAATFTALLGKWRAGNTDADVVQSLALVVESYAGSWSGEQVTTGREN